MRGFHVYIDKSSAEIRDMATMEMTVDIPPRTMRILRHDGWRPPRKLVLGLPPEPNPHGLPADLVLFLYKGVLGTPGAAVAYARVLMRLTRLAKLAVGELKAEGAGGRVASDAARVPGRGDRGGAEPLADQRQGVVG